MHFLRMHVALKTKKTKKEKGNSDFAKSRLAAGMEIRIHDEKKAFNLSRREKSDSSALPVKQHQSCSARTIQSMKAIACCKKKNNNNKKWGGGRDKKNTAAVKYITTCLGYTTISFSSVYDSSSFRNLFKSLKK